MAQLDALQKELLPVFHSTTFTQKYIKLHVQHKAAHVSWLKPVGGIGQITGITSSVAKEVE